MYFTKEGYDDFYYGKGSTYPDINGGIGILFEQASSRGHAQMTEEPGGFAVGGVALVAVDLDYRACVEFWAMVGVVLVGVVGVHRMGVVGRNQ